MNMVTGYEQKLQSNKTTINQSLLLAERIGKERKQQLAQQEKQIEEERLEKEIEAQEVANQLKKEAIKAFEEIQGLILKQITNINLYISNKTKKNTN